MSTESNRPNRSDRRAADGRWIKGTRPGPGNPRAKLVHAHLEAVARAIEPSELVAVLRRLLENAQGGCVASAGLLLDRVLGKARLLSVPLPLSGDLAGDASLISQAAAIGMVDVDHARGLLALALDAETVANLGSLEARVSALEVHHGRG